MSHEQKLTELLEVAEKRPLTETEKSMLQNLLANQDNRLSATAEQHLRKNYIATGQDTQWSPQELSQIATNIHQQTKHHSRWQQRQYHLTHLAWVTAIVFGICGFLFLRFFATLPPTEPAAPLPPTATATPSPTPLPTPTLPADYMYIDLVTASPQQPEVFQTEAYSLTITEASNQWANQFYIPQQLPDNWVFVGATLNKEQEIIELAFMQTYFGTETIWVLSQAPAITSTLTPPLPVTYQPLPRIDNTFDYEDQASLVADQPAHAYQYEYTYEAENTTTTWTVYNTVTWQQNGQLFTLTHISKRLEQSTKTAKIAGYLWLQPIPKDDG